MLDVGDGACEEGVECADVVCLYVSFSSCEAGYATRGGRVSAVGVPARAYDRYGVMGLRMKG